MEELRITLNDFLFNSGVLGFYKILQNSGKTQKVKIEANQLIVPKEIFEHFEEDYISTIQKEYETTTRWYELTNKIDELEHLDVKEVEAKEKVENIFNSLKKALESASYKSAYEIVLAKGEKFSVYDILDKTKKEANLEEKKKLILQLLKYLKQQKETYCMKDIIYNKINVFWENVAFLNRNNNKNDIKEEYRKSFVQPVITYLDQKAKGEYTCVECGNIIGKKDASSMSWLKDVGVDMNRKKSGFWDFIEDSFLCPICNLIYSCVPLGFTMTGANGIFVNCNESFQMLLMQNNQLKMVEDKEKDSLEKIYQNIFYQLLKKAEQIGNVEVAKQEPKNIQVIKRLAMDKDNPKYEFNIISKEKLETFERVKHNFQYLLNRYVRITKDSMKNVYEITLSNFMENKKQYLLLNYVVNDKINNNANIDYMKDIIEIQLNSIGGKQVEEMKKLKEDMIQAGENLQKHYYWTEGNENKVKAYILKLANSLRTNNVNMFMQVVTTMYGGLGLKLPAVDGFSKMLDDEDSFKLLGYAYIMGLEKYPSKKEEGGNENEK